MPLNKALYHPKWSLISRLIRFRRANGKCEWCGASHLEPHPVNGVKTVLTVAHLDQDTTNNRFDNLKALCQRCHLNHDTKEKRIARAAASKKYGRGFRRYVGDLFADTPKPEQANQTEPTSPSPSNGQTT